VSQFLNSLGADADVRSSFEPFARQRLSLGRVCRVDRGAYRTLIESGQEIRAEPTGNLLYRTGNLADLPVVGDWVAPEISGDRVVVHGLLPRRTAFYRRAPGSPERRQVLVANIDFVLIVCGLDGDFNLRRIERYLTLVQASGASAVIALNKTDLCRNIADRLQMVDAVAGAAPVIVIQANLSSGIEPVRSFLQFGQTIALLGSSGAGKSTLANHLLESECQPTAPPSWGNGKGRHTTTSRQLFPLPTGGALIDTPGLRELQLWATSENLDTSFEDVFEIQARCRFRDCSHQSEPGCAIMAALLEGSLDPGRWQNYLKLRREVRHHEIAADEVSARMEKQRWKRIHKTFRNHDKHR
jgi:ribosome biogenesis GTPase